MLQLLSWLASPDLSSPLDLSVIGLFVGFLPIALLANSRHIPLFHRSGMLMAYGKFAHNVNAGCPIPSKWGMCILYLPAAALSIMLSRHFGGRGQLLAYLGAIHFGKRTLECVFVHKFSGSMPVLSSFTISTLYVIVAWIMPYYSNAVPDPMLRDALQLAGCVLFAVGQLGNGYHHVLLANLRSGDSKDYKVPRGGLFECVAAPHYFFELISWLGVAVTSQHMNLFLVFLAMTVYLIDRAANQLRWNQQKIKGYPLNRMRLVPMVY